MFFKCVHLFPNSSCGSPQTKCLKETSENSQISRCFWWPSAAGRSTSKIAIWSVWRRTEVFTPQWFPFRQIWKIWEKSCLLIFFKIFCQVWNHCCNMFLLKPIWCQSRPAKGAKQIWCTKHKVCVMCFFIISSQSAFFVCRWFHPQTLKVPCTAPRFHFLRFRCIRAIAGGLQKR